MTIRKIDFKKPKYIFPLVLFLPICGLAYYVGQMFAGSPDSNEAKVSTDRINATLPEAVAQDPGDKMFEMTRRFSEDEAYTAIGALGEDDEMQESIENGYSEEELNRIDEAEAERLRQQRELEALEQSLAESRKHINSYASAGAPQSVSGLNYSSGQPTVSDYARDLDDIHRASYERQKALERSLGIGVEDKEERAEEQRRDSIAKAREIEREKNRPMLVIKSGNSNADRFNTVSYSYETAESSLIRAMIDRTTKAREGTRLRFKLLDDVTVNGTKLTKGTYLYGIVTGFGQQRVMANISSILIGSKFMKVSLAVYDNDGMEGFYVPESAFRDLLKDAGATTVQQNINFDTGYGSGISGEAIALQALQNMYNSATSAVSKNIRRNKAKIKYNTIVYLINSDDSR